MCKINTGGLAPSSPARSSKRWAGRWAVGRPSSADHHVAGRGAKGIDYVAQHHAIIRLSTVTVHTVYGAVAPRQSKNSPACQSNRACARQLPQRVPKSNCYQADTAQKVLSVIWSRPVAERSQERTSAAIWPRRGLRRLPRLWRPSHAWCSQLAKNLWYLKARRLLNEGSTWRPGPTGFDLAWPPLQPRWQADLLPILAYNICI